MPECSFKDSLRSHSYIYYVVKACQIATLVDSNTKGKSGKAC